MTNQSNTWPDCIGEHAAGLAKPRNWAASKIAPLITEKLIRRFFDKVQKDGPAHPYEPEMGSCWMWGGRTKSEGYGEFTLGSRTDGTRHIAKAHRVSIAISGRPCPENRMTLHTCDNRRCVNPEHLYIGTAKDNSADRARRDRQARMNGEDNGFHKLSDDQVIEIARSNESNTILSARFGISKSVVGKIKNGESWTHIVCTRVSASKPIGSRHGRSKLSEREALEILNSPAETKALSKKYQISEGAVRDIKSGKRWAHLPRPRAVYIARPNKYL